MTMKKFNNTKDLSNSYRLEVYSKESFQNSIENAIPHCQFY